MSWLTFSLIAALCYAIGEVSAKKGLSNLSPLWNNIIANIADLIIWVPFALILSGLQITIPPLEILLVIFLVASCYLIFFYAIEKGPIALTGTVAAGYPVATILLSTIFLSERISLLQTLGIILVILGVITVSLPNKIVSELKNYSWLKWGIAAALVIGAGDFLSKLSINRVGVSSHLIFLSLSFSILSVINFLLDKKGRSLPKFSFGSFVPTILGTSFIVLGTLFFFLAFSVGKASLVAPVSSIYPGLAVILALIFLKEKITFKTGFGILSLVSGIILTGFGG